MEITRTATANTTDIWTLEKGHGVDTYNVFLTSNGHNYGKVGRVVGSGRFWTGYIGESNIRTITCEKTRKATALALVEAILVAA